MYVLGINGWDKGVHDTSASLFYQGKLLAAAEEERFVRRKKAFDTVPVHSISYCLHEAGITADEVDYIALGWDVEQLEMEYGGKQGLTSKDIMHCVFPKNIFPRKKDPALQMYPHHQAHAAGAYYSSGFDDAAILVVDGSGEEESITIAKGEKGNINYLEVYPLECSLGIFYEALSKYIGLGRFKEGKTMGLSSYGLWEEDVPLIVNKHDGYRRTYNQILKDWVLYFFKKFDDKGNSAHYVYDHKEAKLYDQLDALSYKHVAAFGQKTLEENLMHLAKKAIKLTGSSRLCISGGVGLNCVGNRKLLELEEVKDIFIQPAASDAGVSLGAGALLSKELGFDVKLSKDHVYSGPAFSDGEIKDLLERYKIKYEFFENGINEAAVELLKKGSVGARFAGRMEFGPRALGNRSILANPQSKTMLQRVNYIKEREQWRPLAPSINAENQTMAINEETASPFMLLNATIHKSSLELLQAVTHIDGSTRPQIVDKEGNSSYWELIQCFYEETGIPAVLNTSFNIGNEPIVCSPKDAIRSFFCSELDFLFLNHFLIKK
ncbi:carbamoyltransferase [Bacillus safensis]|uniref:carbamoyltransferase family protein n=1 Tax=Bacillus safensis TaxID=561879 RepID=UPI0024993FA4|nr:carbamoyltransferase C-terminal domain-containing protein [Bacillus safensis]GMG77419.1 carbamoyltransferase [Bacillus safensis]